MVCNRKPRLDTTLADGGSETRRERIMKWITREHVKVDRVACPWVIKKFVDSEAEFIFVPLASDIGSSETRGGPL